MTEPKILNLRRIQYRVDTNGTRVWICDVCNNSGIWDKKWSWFGSLRDKEQEKGSKPVIIVCSNKCRNSIIDPLKFQNELAKLEKESV